jgi:hypothetical protein
MRTGARGTTADPSMNAGQTLQKPPQWANGDPATNDGPRATAASRNRKT